MTLEVNTRRSQRSSIITVVGEVDLYTSPKLRSEILDAVHAAEAEVRVDLSEVEYMDSSGVATLVEGFKGARENAKTFTLVAPSQAVMKVLELAKLDGVFEISSVP